MFHRLLAMSTGGWFSLFRNQFQILRYVSNNYNICTTCTDPPAFHDQKMQILHVQKIEILCSKIRNCALRKCKFCTPKNCNGALNMLNRSSRIVCSTNENSVLKNGNICTQKVLNCLYTMEMANSMLSCSNRDSMITESWRYMYPLTC